MHYAYHVALTLSYIFPVLSTLFSSDFESGRRKKTLFKKARYNLM